MSGHQRHGSPPSPSSPIAEPSSYAATSTASSLASSPIGSPSPLGDSPYSNTKSRAISSPPPSQLSAKSDYQPSSRAHAATVAEGVERGDDEYDEDQDDADADVPVGPPPEPSLEDLRITARVMGSEQRSDSKSSYISYIVNVSTGAVSSCGLSWKVQRRYREFAALHEKLVHRFGKDRLPSLPKKALLRSLDAEYVRKKRTELAAYLSDLCLDPEIAASDILAHFLIPSIHTLIRSNIINLHAHTQRGKRIKRLEQQLQRVQQERTQFELDRQGRVKDRDALLDRCRQAEESARLATDELASQHEAWETKMSELVAHARELNKERKTALAFVKDLDVACRRLKQEKRLLVQEVKNQRAQLAAMGVTPGSGPTSSPASSPSSAPPMQSDETEQNGDVGGGVRVARETETETLSSADGTTTSSSVGSGASSPRASDSVSPRRTSGGDRMSAALALALSTTHSTQNPSHISLEQAQKVHRRQSGGGNENVTAQQQQGEDADQTTEG